MFCPHLKGVCYKIRSCLPRIIFGWILISMYQSNPSLEPNVNGYSNFPFFLSQLDVTWCRNSGFAAEPDSIVLALHTLPPNAPHFRRHYISPLHICSPSTPYFRSIFALQTLRIAAPYVLSRHYILPLHICTPDAF